MTHKLKYGGQEENLLESVIHLTSLRERDSLEISLVTTLNWMIQPRKIVLYKIRHHQGVQEVVLEVVIDGGKMVVNFDEYDHDEVVRLDSRAVFAECLETRKAVVSKCVSGSGDLHDHIFPVFGNRDTIVGFFEVISEYLDESSHRLITGFLEIYHNYLTIIDDSQRDTLTGLLNRKTFDNNIAKIIETQQQADNGNIAKKNKPQRRKGHEDSSHWLAVIDIDHFKSVNDRFGHLYGDEVLLLLAQIMEKTFREQDKLFRFGGEEFVVVLAPASFDDAKYTFERFRKNIEDYDFPQVGRVTVSIGFVRIFYHDIPSTFVGHADEALYYAKHNGRNQVCSYEDLIAKGALESEHFKSELELF